MTGSPNKRAFSAAAALAAGCLLSVIAVAQTEPPDQQEPRDPQDTQGTQDTRDTGTPDRFYLGPRPGQAPADAQASGPPRSILPGPYVPPGSIAPATPDAGDPSIAPSAPVAGVPEGTDGVAVGALDALDPSAVGVLEPQTGGLPYDLWDGTRRADVVRLLPRLPVATPSPAMNALARRLLLSSARMPEGDGGAGSADLLVARIERLHASGDLEGLTALMERVPPAVDDPGLRRFGADAALVAGRYDDACATARQAVAEEGAAYWVKLIAFCRALDGDRAGTDFQVRLLEETEDLPLVFYSLIDRVLLASEQTAAEERDRPITEPMAADPLLFAMARLLDAEIQAAELADTPPLLLSALAATPLLPLEQRLTAAAEAARLGLMSGTAVAGLFDALTYSDVERSSALMLLDSDLGLRVDGLLYRLAAEEPDPVAQARWMLTAWDRALAHDFSAPAAAALAGPLGRLQPTAELAFFAHGAGRIHLMNGRIDQARLWYDLVRGRAAQSDLDATKALVELWPLMLVADVDGRLPFSGRILDLWWQGQAVLPADDRLSRAALLFGMLEALDYPVPEALWRDLLTGPESVPGTTPALGVWRGLIVASESAVLGETVLLGLMGVGERGPQAADPSVLSAAVRALKRVGLEADARRIAFEALVSRGF